MCRKEVKIRLIELGINQTDLANEYGCSKTLISKAINGNVKYPKIINFLEDHLQLKIV